MGVRLLVMMALPAYDAFMQYTLRDIPARLDSELRRRAHRQHRSLNAVAIELLSRALGLTEQPIKRRSVRDMLGTWRKDRQFEEAMKDFEKVDKELWK